MIFSSVKVFSSLWLFLSFSGILTQGLICYTCWKLICDEEYEACYEMRHFPSANERMREISRHWRTSPECPDDGNDLRWSHSYLQNCSEGETSCGSFLIQVTAAIAKNSINETEFPILVTPNYYQGSIIAMGCIPLLENDADNNTNINFKGPLYITEVSADDSTRNINNTTRKIEIQNAPHVVRPHYNNNNYSSGTSNGSTFSNISTSTTTAIPLITNSSYSAPSFNQVSKHIDQSKTNISSSSTSSTKEDNVTDVKIPPVKTASPPVKLPNPPLKTAGQHVTNASSPAKTASPPAKTATPPVILANPPLKTAILPENIASPSAKNISPAYTNSTTRSDAHSVVPEQVGSTKNGGHPGNAGYTKTLEATPLNIANHGDVPVALPLLGPVGDGDVIVPLMTSGLESLYDNVCKVALSHDEIQTVYGALVRINITGKYEVCDYCSEDLCNINIPSASDTTSESIPEDNNTIEGSSDGAITSSRMYLLVIVAATLITI